MQIHKFSRIFLQILFFFFTFLLESFQQLFFFYVMISKKYFLCAVGFRIFFSIFLHPLLYIYFFTVTIFYLFFFVLSFLIFYFFSLKILKKVLVFILNDQFNLVIIQNNITFFKKFNKNIPFFFIVSYFVIDYIILHVLYTRSARV